MLHSAFAARNTQKYTTIIKLENTYKNCSCFMYLEPQPKFAKFAVQKVQGGGRTFCPKRNDQHLLSLRHYSLFTLYKHHYIQFYFFIKARSVCAKLNHFALLLDQSFLGYSMHWKLVLETSNSKTVHSIWNR